MASDQILAAKAAPDHVRFACDTAGYFGHSFTASHAIAQEELEALQLAALRYRFAELYNSVPMVKKLADRQNFDGVDALDDIVPMLFEHTMYKSYPPSLLRDGRFDLLTTWLDKLTAHDLTGLDTSQCEGLMDWIDLLDAETPLKINHSSGTSGVMSFNPFGKDEVAGFGRNWPVFMLQEFGDAATPPDYVPGLHVVSPTHRYGANAFIRSVDIFAKFIAGSEGKVHTLYPDRLDSDVLYLAAQINAAKAKGTLSNLGISPLMLAKQRDFEAQRARAMSDTEVFYASLVERLAGERVFMVSTWNTIHDLATEATARGLSKVFASDSVIISGGGAKGMVQPADWQDVVLRFTGVPRLRGGYGMSELGNINPMCRHGNFHLSPALILFVLDPDTSLPLPRSGVVTGRAAFYDLGMQSHWGGIITGDEVTVHWDGNCPCGASSAYFDKTITRYSEKRGGDDKITCASTPAAHDEAIDFLVDFKAI